eukprot:347961-Chlamydomonas_euryale.AAC.4
MNNRGAVKRCAGASFICIARVQICWLSLKWHIHPSMVAHASPSASVSQVGWSRYWQTESWGIEMAAAAKLANGGFQYRAPDAVACSLLALAFHFDEPEVAVQAAVHYGGDTDTIPCMTGALAGALHGRTWLPQRWLSQLENGAAGRDEVLRLATDLANLDVRGMARGPVRIEFTASIVSVNFVDPHTRVAQHICTFKTLMGDMGVHGAAWAAWAAWAGLHGAAWGAWGSMELHADAVVAI